MSEFNELMKFVDEVSLSSTNAIINIIRERKKYKESGGRPSLSFLHNNQWYRTLSTKEKKEFRRLALMYITAG